MMADIGSTPQEYESLRRVEASCVLEGLAADEWQELGRRMARSSLLHTGAVEFIRRLRGPQDNQNAAETSIDLHVLSANWSKDFLVGLLDGIIEPNRIYTNEVTISS